MMWNCFLSACAWCSFSYHGWLLGNCDKKDAGVEFSAPCTCIVVIFFDCNMDRARMRFPSKSAVSGQSVLKELCPVPPQSHCFELALSLHTSLHHPLHIHEALFCRFTGRLTARFMGMKRWNASLQ
jgi:hypothetical protein